MKTQEQLLNNVIGQLEGIKKIIAGKEKDCFKAIIQMKAARSAISSIMEKYIRENFTACTSVCRDRKDREKIEKLVGELIRNH